MKTALVGIASKLRVFAGKSGHAVASYSTSKQHKTREAAHAESCRMHDKVMKEIAVELTYLKSATKNALCTWIVSHCADDPGGTGSIRALLNNPYAPVLELPGNYSIQEAMEVATKSAKMPLANQAARAAHLLIQLHAQDGHVFMPAQLLHQKVADLLSTDETPIGGLAIEYAIADQQGGPLELAFDGSTGYSLPSLKRASERIALHIRACQRESSPLYPEVFNPASAQAVIKFSAQGEQAQAAYGVLSSACSLHTLTGKPGTGKTTVLRLIATMLAESGIRIRFAAPTGQAAKVISSKVADMGHACTTVHQLLEVGPLGFGRNAQHPLDADLVIIDEAGMLDLELADALIQALPRGAHLLLVGDDRQLQSVSPGSVLQDCLESSVDHWKLGFTHRNNGPILELVDGVRNYRFQVPNDPQVRHFQDFIAAEFESAYLAAVASSGPDAVCVITPYRYDASGALYRGVQGFNRGLQQLMNPNGEPVQGTGFRVGDRVINRRNRWIGDLYLANGDRGTLIHASPLSFTVSLDSGGHEVELDRFRHAQDWELAYAGTVHQSQGSEYDHVFLCLYGFASSFLDNAMLYTGLSRARKTLCIYGVESQLKQIARRKPQRRFSLISRALQNPTTQRASHV